MAGGIFPLGFVAGFAWRLLRKESTPRARIPLVTQAKTNKFCFLGSNWFSECDHLFICKINLLTVYLGRVQNREYHGQQQAGMLNKVLLDSCSRFNVLNFPRSQKWKKYQKGSGSRVLVFLQEFWNPSYSSVLVRSQKNRSNNTQFFMKKVTYSQLSPTFPETETIFVASPRPVSVCPSES